MLTLASHIVRHRYHEVRRILHRCGRGSLKRSLPRAVLNNINSCPKGTLQTNSVHSMKQAIETRETQKQAANTRGTSS